MAEHNKSDLDVAALLKSLVEESFFDTGETLIRSGVPFHSVTVIDDSAFFDFIEPLFTAASREIARLGMDPKEIDIRIEGHNPASVYGYLLNGKQVFSSYVYNLHELSENSNNLFNIAERNKDSSIEEASTRTDPQADETERSGARRLRRLYRKAHELPDPSQPSNAEVNRSKRQVKLRLPPDLIEQIDARASEDGYTRNDWMEAALKSALKPR